MNEFVGPDAGDFENVSDRLTHLKNERDKLKIIRIKFERRYDWSKQAIEDALTKIVAEIETIDARIEQLEAG